MGTCETCKHWTKRKVYETGHSFGLGGCANTPMFWDATEWSDDCSEGRILLDKYKDTKAFVQDGSDYKADLLTLSNFGCVSYENLTPPSFNLNIQETPQ